MPLHLYFKVSSITHLFEKPTGTFDHLLITVQGLFQSFHYFLFFQHLFKIFNRVFLLRVHICKWSLTRTHPPIHLQVKDEDEKVQKAFLSRKCQVELFF